MNKKHAIIWKSLLITILIFSSGVILNHFFDFYRINEINSVMRDHELDSDAYRVERLFSEVFDEEACDIMTARFFGLKEEIKKVGADLGTYSRFSIFRKTDYDLLKREYILLQLKFYALLKQLNTDCGQPYLPVLFFYTIDEDESERQGFILEDLANSYKNQVVILAIDKDYKDEPLVPLLVEHYGITRTPAVVINEEVTFGLHYVGQINSTVQQFLRRPDPYAYEIDFSFTPLATGVNMTLLASDMEKIANNQSEDNWARGDATIILGRLTKNNQKTCESLQYFDKINSTNTEEMALVYETSAALGCGRNRNAFLNEAAKQWKKAGNNYRARLLETIAQGKKPILNFDESAVTANETVISGYYTPIKSILSKGNFTSVTIGATSINLDNNSRLITQDDRVFRDWLGGQIANPYGPKILTTFSEKRTYNETELRTDIGWHEGGRTKELLYLNLTHIPAVGTLVAKKNGRWFASDENGIFRFEVPLDKVYYPTTRFLRPDVAVIIDSHGVNMLVEQAIRHNATHILSDIDHPGKAYAAKYLSDRKISVIAYPDKYLFLLMGHNTSIVGSAPTTFFENHATIGNRPINITTKDKLVVANSTDNAYALWYYQTPASYFSTITQAIPLDATYVTLDAFGTQDEIINTAKRHNANIIATRVFSKDDYEKLGAWLSEDANRKAILFHTASYPYGQLLFREFVNQTSFDDPNPIFQ